MSWSHRWVAVLTGGVVVGSCAFAQAGRGGGRTPPRAAPPAAAQDAGRPDPSVTARGKQPGAAPPRTPASGSNDTRSRNPRPSTLNQLAAGDFFEAQVRPVLAENCISCHGADRQLAGLRLDQPALILKGGDRGPVVVPGDPDKSALIRAVRYTGSVKMPPQGKLPGRAIEALTTWVKIGAPLPASPPQGGKGPQAGGSTTAPAGAFVITEPQSHHWAFQPVKKPSLPTVKDRKWPTAPIDFFILAKLEKSGLRPAPPADKVTLLRRATFDLTGLPPTIAEIDAFLADHSPGAFARVVDRLLASPRYGERWGRYWLDIARYADTKGYTFQEDSHYPNAYIYRDYVIRAFNDDLPYDQFILQQLAADRLPLKEDKRPLAAMGFLTVGRRFLNNQHDIIDDRIDVVSRGLMGLTVACARCHNHKFDPIPTKDYYSLYGVFASSIEPAPVVITPPSRNEPYVAHEKRLKEAEQQVAALVKTQEDRLQEQFRSHVGDYLLAVREIGSRSEPKFLQSWAAEHSLNPLVLQRWQHYLQELSPVHRPIFAPWLALESVRREPQGVSKDVPKEHPSELTPHASRLMPAQLNPLVAKLIEGSPASAPGELAQRYSALFASVDKHWRDTLRGNQVAAALAAENGQAAPKAPTFLPEPAEESLRQVLYARNGPLGMTAEELEPYFAASARESLKTLRQAAAKLRETLPPAPEYAMVLEDASTPHNAHVLIRGNPGNPGDEAPRQFLQILSGANRRPFQSGSGRLELAQAIASQQNPLTARVMVNRVWLHHFGEGLVRTPSDFGMRSEPPSHPELLDYLAARFSGMGWSIKKLHRLILLSSTYQMSSDYSARAAKIDPENHLLWRMNRRRLELEPLRDALLAVSGQLDPTIGGPAVEITKPPYPNRRTVYGFIDRQNLQGLFRTFDLASPDTTNAQRHETTVPQQALFMLNSPFVVEQVRHLARRPELLALSDPARRIRYLYRLLYGRLPTSEEGALGLEYLKAAPVPVATAAEQLPPLVRQIANIAGSPAAEAPKPLSPWEQYIQVLLMTNEFAFVD